MLLKLTSDFIYYFILFIPVPVSLICDSVTVGAVPLFGWNNHPPQFKDRFGSLTEKYCEMSFSGVITGPSQQEVTGFESPPD